MRKFGLRAIVYVKREERDYTFGWKKTYPSYAAAAAKIIRFKKIIEQIFLPQRNLTPADVVIQIYVIEVDDNGIESSSSVPQYTLEGV